MDIRTIIFLAISAVTIGSACVVAFSRNLVHSAFALLGAFAGVMGLYILLSADFVAIVQLVIYIGGILVLILFAVMLTTKIGQAKITNRTMAPMVALPAVAALGALIWRTYRSAGWAALPSEEFVPTTALIGEKLLGDYLLPFEVASLLLVLVMVGAVVLGRREVKC
ncbi:MAG: NADH-quinone oxidoreductase subunit J [Pseudomonadota bacterium]